jgi:hypothetical protein
MCGAARPFFTLTLLLTHEFVSQYRRHDNRMIENITFISVKADTGHDVENVAKLFSSVFCNNHKCVLKLRAEIRDNLQICGYGRGEGNAKFYNRWVTVVFGSAKL